MVSGQVFTRPLCACTQILNVCQTIAAVNSVSCLQEQLIHLSESLVVNLLALP